MQVQEEQEVKILEKIKVKMERIKANQKKIQGVISKEPLQHDAGKLFIIFLVFKITCLLPRYVSKKKFFKNLDNN